MENRLRGWSDLAKTTQEPEREWAPAKSHWNMCWPSAQPMQGLLCASEGFRWLAVWGKADLAICHPNHNCPGLLMQGKGSVIPLHLLYLSTSPNLLICSSLAWRRPKKIQLFHFLFSAGSLRDVHTLATLPSQTMPGWWPRLVKRSYTRWAKSPCIWYLLETAQTTKAEG